MCANLTEIDSSTFIFSSIARLSLMSAPKKPVTSLLKGEAGTILLGIEGPFAIVHSIPPFRPNVQ